MRDHPSVVALSSAADVGTAADTRLGVSAGGEPEAGGTLMARSAENAVETLKSH